MKARFDKLEVCYVINKKGNFFHFAMYERPLREFNFPMKKVFEKIYSINEINTVIANCNAKGIYDFNKLYEPFLSGS